MRRFSLPFLLLCCLLNVSVGHSQANRRAAMDYVSRGTKELELGNLDTALAHFNRAIELDPNYAASYFSRGLVRKRQADYDGAISALHGRSNSILWLRRISIVARPEKTRVIGTGPSRKEKTPHNRVAP